MRRKPHLTTWIVAPPIVLLAVWIALANRAPVVFSLDPFSQDDPALAVRLPVYVLIFSSVLTGILLGWLVLGLRRIARQGVEMAQSASGRARALLPARLRKTKTPSS
ncbi:MAG TPA: hypothetical protein VGB91_01500 [Rhizomicrobium sp.]